MNKRIAIAIEETADNKELIAEHFGRCNKILVKEVNPGKEIVQEEEYFNPLSGHTGGTCQLPGYINQFSVNTVIAGGMGTKAITNFQAFGIEVITAPGLSKDEALKLYLDGKLAGYDECAHTDHGC